MRKILVACLVLQFIQIARAGNPKLPDLKPLDTYTLLDLADVWAWKNLDTAFFINDRALEKARAKQDKAEEFYTLRERGIYFEKYNQPEKAIPEYEQAMNVLANLKEKNQYLPVIFNDLAIVSRKCGQYAQCRHYHEQALKIARETKNLELEEDSYHGIGFLLETVGEWDAAIEWYQKSVEVAERRGSKEGVVISYQNIANVLQKSGNEPLALEKIEQAIQLSVQCDSFRQAHALHDYGQILSAAGRHSEALAKFNASLAFYEKLGDRPMIARSLSHIAQSHERKGDLEVAFEFFQKCLSLEKDIRTEDLANLKLHFGEMQVLRKDFASAEKAFSECLMLSQKYGFKDLTERTHRGLAQVFEKTGRVNLALLHQKKATEWAELVENSEKDLRSAELEFRFEAKRKEKTIGDLQNRNRLILVGSVAAAALLAAVSFIFLFGQKLRHNRQLQSKNQEIERSNQQLRDSNAVLQQFAYATAHDLKEPLRTIGSFVGLLQRRHGASFPPEAIEYFEFVKTGAHRMNTLLSDLLEYSTVFMDTPGKGGTDIFKGLGEVVGNLRSTIEQRGATIELPIALPLPLMAIQKSHFVQLFQNLMGNAIKFSPRDPRVVVAIRRDEPGFFTVSVSDNGIGIDKNYGNKIFQIFQRLDRQNFEGAGIGLAICKNIVEKYGGSIWFDSEQGRGTTFFVRIPVLVQEEIFALAN